MPDATTLLHLRHLLERHQLIESIFNAIGMSRCVPVNVVPWINRPRANSRQEWLEQAKVSIRAKVEYPFHVVKNPFRHRKTRYRGLAKNAAQLFSLFGLANLMLARRWLLNPQGQVAS